MMAIAMPAQDASPSLAHRFPVCSLLALNTIEQDVLVANTPGLLSPLLNFISDTPELEAFMKEVIALPSLLPLLRHGGLSTIVTLDFSTEFRTRSMHGALEVYGDRLTIEANGTLALDARAHAGRGPACSIRCSSPYRARAASSRSSGRWL